MRATRYRSRGPHPNGGAATISRCSGLTTACAVCPCSRYKIARRSTQMARTNPPFRADHVGSFLRPAAVKEARAKREQGKLSAGELADIENREIEQVIKKQEAAGLKLATDGE